MKRKPQYELMTQEEVISLWPKVVEGDSDARRAIAEGHLSIILDWAHKVGGDLITTEEAISKLSLAVLVNMPNYRPSDLTFRQWLTRQKCTLWREIQRSAAATEKKLSCHVPIKIDDLPAAHPTESSICCRVPTSSELALLLIPERDRTCLIRTLDLPHDGCATTMRQIGKDLGLTTQRVSQIVCMARCLFRVYLGWIDCPKCHAHVVGGLRHHIDVVPSKHQDAIRNRIFRAKNVRMLRDFVNRRGTFARSSFSMPNCH